MMHSTAFTPLFRFYAKCTLIPFSQVIFKQFLQNVSGPSKTNGDASTNPGLSGESDIRHQVVAVGKLKHLARPCLGVKSGEFR